MTPANPSSPPAPLYSERLAAPPSYWAIALFFGLSFVTAVGVYLGPEGALAAALVTAGLIAGVLAWIGGARIAVDDRGLTVGAALLEWPYLGDVVRLDREATRRRLGVDADARAFVVERPYITDAVEVGVADPADPHPYWLVSTRHPAQLALALERGRAASGGAS